MISRAAPSAIDPLSLPSHLDTTEAKGIAPNQAVAQFELGDHRNFIYVILDWSTRQAVLVDPQFDIDTPLEAIQEHGFQLSFVLLTHTHSDHTAGVPELLRRFPKLPIYTQAHDARRLSKSIREKVQLLEDGQTLPLGKLSIRVIHTPGHSAGECSYAFEADRPYLLTGDTIFIRDCGRTDLDSGSNEQMFESLQKIKALPPETVILPGHHYVRECATTIAREMKESPPFQCKSVEELAALP
jgi:glyoxylase-like metal-dependent hydrolase (beta-lactamase superfamily II)